ncbi:MAG: SGNH/GDSL hydrolase family protein [Candidatus Omnitrophica bacterium]|nr:SGNH/GDSL hydrolase family protein [Candidatus Omnitrophota bacterium]
MKKVSVTLLKKFCVFLIGLFVGLCLLEAGLRVVGYIVLHQRSQVRKIAQVRKNRNAQTILFLGDSYTFGGNVSVHQNFPSQFEEILKTKRLAQDIRVVNGGWCEQTTRDLLPRLKKILSTHQPDVIVLLIGAANRYNLDDYDFSRNQLFYFLTNLRVYKMARIIAVNLKANRLAHDARHFGLNADLYKKRVRQLRHFQSIDQYSEDLTLDQKAFYYFNKGDHDKAWELIHVFLKSHPESLEALMAAGFFHYKKYEYAQCDVVLQRIIKICETRIANNQTSERVRSHLAFAAVSRANFLLVFRRHADAIDYIFKTLLIEPNGTLLQYLIRSYSLQSKYSAADMVGFYDELFRKKPELRDFKLFLNNYRYFSDEKVWEKRLESWLRDDLDEIVRICRQSGVTLILQNYPFPYAVANTAIEDVARKYSLPVIDQLSYFEELIGQGFENDYLEDDAHCTVKGYQHMARHIYDYLSSINMLEVRK